MKYTSLPGIVSIMNWFSITFYAVIVDYLYSHCVGEFVRICLVVFTFPFFHPALSNVMLYLYLFNLWTNARVFSLQSTHQRQNAKPKTLKTPQSVSWQGPCKPQSFSEGAAFSQLTFETRLLHAGPQSVQRRNQGKLPKGHEPALQHAAGQARVSVQRAGDANQLAGKRESCAIIGAFRPCTLWQVGRRRGRWVFSRRGTRRKWLGRPESPTQRILTSTIWPFLDDIGYGKGQPNGNLFLYHLLGFP